MRGYNALLVLRSESQALDKDMDSWEQECSVIWLRAILRSDMVSIIAIQFVLEAEISTFKDLQLTFPGSESHDEASLQGERCLGGIERQLGICRWWRMPPLACVGV